MMLMVYDHVCFMLTPFTQSTINPTPDSPPACQAFFFVVCYTWEKVKGLSCQYSRTKPPFGLISIRVTFLLGKSKRSRPQRNEYRVIDLDTARLLNLLSSRGVQPPGQPGW